MHVSQQKCMPMCMFTHVQAAASLASLACASASKELAMLANQSVYNASKSIQKPTE